MKSCRWWQARRRLLTLVLAAPAVVSAQAPCNIKHLSIFDANVAELADERVFQLQPGLNTIDWRGLAPQAIVRSIHVTAENITVIRQDITYDGPSIRNQQTPSLHLLLQNNAGAGPRKVQVDYLAPNLSWKADYSILLPGGDGPPEQMLLDGWVSIQNDTGSDICADALDLIVGEVQLLYPNGTTNMRDSNANSQWYSGQAPMPISGSGPISTAEVKGLSVFSRFRLGRSVSMPANSLFNRLPIFQSLKLPVKQHDVFENDAKSQTLARGGFMLLPRGLETRLVSSNKFTSPLPPGIATVYVQDGESLQVVGQDNVPLTPVGGDFTVSQGRSAILQGTRRIVNRQEVPDTTVRIGRRLVTQIEIVITNRSALASTAFVREGIENWDTGEWSIPESSHPYQKLGDHLTEFKLSVPAKSSVKVTYTVDAR
jgi:hypothetical protein